MVKKCPECGKPFHSINQKFINHRTEQHNMLLSDQIKKAITESDNSQKSEVDNQ